MLQCLRGMSGGLGRRRVYTHPTTQTTSVQRGDLIPFALKKGMMLPETTFLFCFLKLSCTRFVEILERVLTAQKKVTHVY